jgi:hypothetical protein
MSKKKKSEILSTCLREAAPAKAGEIRNKHEFPKHKMKEPPSPLSSPHWGEGRVRGCQISKNLIIWNFGFARPVK